MTRDRKIERAARAIGDDVAGDCSNDCRWGRSAEDCFCQEEALRLATLAVDAAWDRTWSAIAIGAWLGIAIAGVWHALS